MLLQVPECLLPYVYELETLMLANYFSHLRYFTNRSEESVMHLTKMDFPMFSEHVDLKLVTPKIGYELRNMLIGHPVWNLWLDNVHFSIPMLMGYFTGMRGD